ncbi:MAG: hypothetical protein EPN53_03325 [Acidobacteria bacterium]|nr:MAG: hypothetical protein EPN53_03325 [Acidobacteriota bacterium]
MGTTMRDRTHPRIEALLDGELAGEEAARAAAHVTRCGECQGAVAAYRALGEALAAPEAPLPVGFAAATRRRAVARRRPEAPLWWLTLPAPWRAGLVALLALAALAGARLGETVAADRSAATQLAAALDAPAAAAIAAAPAEVRR